MTLPGLGITWEWTRWLLRNLGHGIFFRSISGLVHIFSTHPRLTPWAGFFRRFATRKMVAPFSQKGSSSDQTAAGTRCRFCGSKPVLKRRAIFGTRLRRWEPRGSSTDLAHITTPLGSFKIWRFRVCATTFVLRDNNWSRALLSLSGPESRTHTCLLGCGGFVFATEIEVHGGSDDQREDHGEQDAADDGDGERLQHLRARADCEG